MITGQVTEVEFIAAHQLHRRRTAHVLNVAMAIAVSVGLVLIIVGATKVGLIVFLGGIGGLIGELVQARVFVPMRCRKLYEQIKGRSDVTYSWSSAALNLVSIYGNAERPWAHYEKARENDRVIILYYNDAVFEIIAKRWFKDSEQIASFRRNLKVVE